MKRFLVSLLCICMIVGSFASMPISAEVVSTNVAVGKTATITTSGAQYVNFSGYGAAQAVDGDDATISLITGISNFSSGANTYGATLMVVELDKAYDITNIQATPAALTDIKSALTAIGYPTLVNVPDGNWNGCARIYVSNEMMTLSNLTTVGTRVGQYDSLKTMSQFTLSGTETYKYVAIHVPSATYPCAIKDLKIFADVEQVEEPVVIPTVNKNVAANKNVTLYQVDNGGTAFSNTGYEGAKMVDNDTDTFALGKRVVQISSGLAGCSTHMGVIDLGESYNINKITTAVPTSDQLTTAIDSLGYSSVINSANINMTGAYVLTNEVPSINEFSVVNNVINYSGSGEMLYAGTSFKSQGTIELTDEQKGEYRYVVMYAPFSYGFAFSEVTAWAEVPALTTVNKTVTADATAELYYGSSLINNTGYEASKMIDGQSDTFGYGKLSNTAGHLAVIDLGDEYDVTKIAITFPQTAEVQTAIDALKAANNGIFGAIAGDANLRSVVIMSNTKPTCAMFSGLDYTGEGKIVYNTNADIRYSKTFEDADIEDGNDYRYICVYTPYSYGVAISEINVWADVQTSMLEPMAMHFSRTSDLTGEAAEDFGIGQLYYNGRIVNETNEVKNYTAFVTSYKDEVLQYVDVETISVEPNSYTDVSIPVIHKIGMDNLKGFLWDELNSPIGDVSIALTKDNGYDPLFDGSILTMTPQVYDATTVIEEYNQTATTALPLTGISEFANVDTIFYDGIKYQGQTKKTFAYVALPEGASAENPVPGVVLVHGGGGTAYDRWAKAWADKGYAAISIDTEGRINTKTNSYSNSGRTVSGMGHKSNASYDDFTSNESNQSDMWFYQAASDAILAGNLLRSLPEVDASKIGITGISYGSMITMTAIGADNRFSFAAPVYGCGYGWESPTYWHYKMTEEKKAWDPIMFIKQTGDMPILWFVTNRDQNFAMEELTKSYTDEDVFSKANLVILDNYSHTEELGSIIDTTLDASKYYLNAERQQQMTDAMIEFAEKAFGQDTKGLSKVSRLTNNNGQITATVDLPQGVSADGATAVLRYVTVADYDDLYGSDPNNMYSTWWLLKADGTVGTTHSYNSPWPKVDATVTGTTISVTAPANATYGFIDYYDSRNIQTSSEMIKIR